MSGIALYYPNPATEPWVELLDLRVLTTENRPGEQRSAELFMSTPRVQQCVVWEAGSDFYGSLAVISMGAWQ